MRANRNIVVILMSLICSFTITAQEIVPIDPTNLLTKEQKRTQQYAKKVLRSQNNTISLPIEFNNLIGDSLTNTPYKLDPNWSKAYFVEAENKCANLFIPLVAKKNGIQSVLNVFRDNEGNFYRIVLTYNQTQKDAIKEEIIMESNLAGFLLNAEILHNGKLVSQINGVVGDNGIVEYKSSSKKNKISYDRFSSVNPSYQKNYADTYEFLQFNDKPYVSWGTLKTAH